MEECTFSSDNKECNCILHCKKDTWYELHENGSKDWSKSKKNIDRFWEKIQEKLKYLNNHEQEVYENNSNSEREYTEYIDYDEPLIYEKYIFPEFQVEAQSSIGDNFYTISDDNSNEQYEVKIFQDKNLEFIDCDFLGKTEFKKYTFSRSVKFLNCNFHNNDVDFSDKVFKKSLFFKGCKKIGKLNLQGSTIQGSASFSRSKFITVDFERVTFETAVAFNESTFYNDLDFKYTIFNSLVYFQDVVIQGKLNLKSTIFKDEVNFLGIKKQDDKKLEPNNIENRETARIIKHSFEKLNNIIEANKFYALEMQKREEELIEKKEKNWLDWIVFKIHKISSNHSQDWLLALLWMLNITMVFTVFSNISPCQKDIVLFMSISLIAIIYFGILLEKHLKKYLFVISTLIYCLNSVSLNDMSNNFNPFSIMTEKEPLTFISLIYKSIIAYLIYQFIISIRQNTRRK